MSKELVIEITTGIIVLGSLFGAYHLRKLEAWIRKSLSSHKSLKKTSD